MTRRSSTITLTDRELYLLATSVRRNLGNCRRNARRARERDEGAYRINFETKRAQDMQQLLARLEALLPPRDQED